MNSIKRHSVRIKIRLSSLLLLALIVPGSMMSALPTKAQQQVFIKKYGLPVVYTIELITGLGNIAVFFYLIPRIRDGRSDEDYPLPPGFKILGSLVLVKPGIAGPVLTADALYRFYEQFKDSAMLRSNITIKSFIRRIKRRIKKTLNLN